MNTQTTTVDIKDLANYVVKYCHLMSSSINSIKLQKLLYYIQAFHLAYFEKHPLFKDEPEAWVNGPVYRVIYDEYKNQALWEMSASKKEAYQEALDKLQLSDEQIKYFQSVLTHYGNKTTEDLIVRTHRDKPWNEAREGLGELDYSSEIITHEMMYDYYTSVINKKNG
jgi:uncharacterized phage-associated protein